MVEDDPLSLEVIVRIIKRTGCTVDKARNGKDAVQLADQHQYALIIMDCSLPLMDGMEATQAIRNLQAPSAKAIIIGVTGNPAIEFDECLDAGMNGFLRKPARIDDYLQLVNQWIKGAPPVDSTSPSS